MHGSSLWHSKGPLHAGDRLWGCKGWEEVRQGLPADSECKGPEVMVWQGGRWIVGPEGGARAVVMGPQQGVAGPYRDCGLAWRQSPCVVSADGPGILSRM